MLGPSHPQTQRCGVLAMMIRPCRPRDTNYCNQAPAASRTSPQVAGEASAPPPSARARRAQRAVRRAERAVVQMHDAGVIGLTLLPMLYYIGLALPIVLYILSRRRLRADQPPSATGWRPLIGHALSYKGDPAAFLTKQCCTVGPCFSIDLAGKKMVVVGHCREAVRQLACASESVLSSFWCGGRGKNFKILLILRF